jgi:hypothetical protein
MNDLEKELLVVNLITQPQNMLNQSRIQAYNARIAKTKKTKEKVTYTIILPPDYLGQSMEIYKVWLIVNENEGSRVEKIEKSSLLSQKDRVKIQFSLRPDNKEKKETSGEMETYFVLVNHGMKQAHAYIHGIEPYEEDPQLVELEKKKITAKGKKHQRTVSEEELNHILQGAADYCQRLKQSAFHFYCREKIVETRTPLSPDTASIPHISTDTQAKATNTALRQVRNIAHTKVKEFLFGYRLIKQGNRIKEEREWISSADNKKVNRDQVVKTNVFFSEKAVFAPLTILDRSRQDKYNFQFIHYDQQNGRPAAVIEALPKDPVETATIYGILWIDREDFSLLKIKADPRSIKSYKKLKELAGDLHTKLNLSLEIDFNFQQQGIRFPTKVNFLEHYKGGRIIYNNHGPEGWKRIRARFDYSDYQFFAVQTEVTVQKRP